MLFLPASLQFIQQRNTNASSRKRSGREGERAREHYLFCSAVDVVFVGWCCTNITQPAINILKNFCFKIDFIFVCFGIYVHDVFNDSLSLSAEECQRFCCFIVLSPDLDTYLFKKLSFSNRISINEKKFLFWWKENFFFSIALCDSLQHFYGSRKHVTQKLSQIKCKQMQIRNQ